MTPSEFIAEALVVPHVPGEGQWSGMDCWGVVEMYYHHVLGVELMERSSHNPGPHGLASGYAASSDQWKRLSKPQDHCLVLMRSGKFAAGHIGVYYQQAVLHSGQETGCIYERYDNVKGRVTGLFAKQ